ncbi:hypothetical protein [Chitinophaga nivalis]|uniref:Uncharacterized protein n=1 Tax=Chitinophaga nivalis TaxID=2991709 RepID=A0ABT3IGA8_9BACT|nr:hypothetical protein [Chitinophaga nivalis]MCW3467319.1 hypothetical protein [Chitinophaga nivalis]MCW3482989.1 hypothetical protein [Chitinophaga nivalis]
MPDYLWGQPVVPLIQALTGNRLIREAPRPRFVRIGAIAGRHLSVPAAALRSSRLEIYGSGGGGVAPDLIYSSSQSINALSGHA